MIIGENMVITHDHLDFFVSLQKDGSPLSSKAVGSAPDLLRERSRTASDVHGSPSPSLTIPEASDSSAPMTPPQSPAYLKPGSMSSLGASPGKKGDDVKFFLGDPDAQSIASSGMQSQEHLEKPLATRPSRVTFGRFFLLILSYTMKSVMRHHPKFHQIWSLKRGGLSPPDRYLVKKNDFSGRWSPLGRLVSSVCSHHKFHCSQSYVIMEYGEMCC